MGMLCGCGEELHYTDPDIQRAVERLIAERGECVLINVVGDDRGVWVPRHYVALHRFKGYEVAGLAERYGWAFED